MRERRAAGRALGSDVAATLRPIVARDVPRGPGSLRGSDAPRAPTARPTAPAEVASTPPTISSGCSASDDVAWVVAAGADGAAATAATGCAGAGATAGVAGAGGDAAGASDVTAAAGADIAAGATGTPIASGAGSGAGAGDSLRLGRKVNGST